MRYSKNTCVIERRDNVLVVDFTRRSEPPAPRFPGANALRENTTKEVHAFIRR